MVERAGSDAVSDVKHRWCESRDFARSFASLDEIYTFVEPALYARGISAAETYAIIMTIEELFTNMVKYNSTGRGPISLQVESSADAITCRLIDPDSERFNMTEVPDVDSREPIEQRQPGGFGIHLIRRIVDSISYDYSERCSTVVFVKKLSGSLSVHEPNDK